MRQARHRSPARWVLGTCIAATANTGRSSARLPQMLDRDVVVYLVRGMRLTHVDARRAHALAALTEMGIRRTNSGVLCHPIGLDCCFEQVLPLDLCPTSACSRSMYLGLHLPQGIHDRLAGARPLSCIVQSTVSTETSLKSASQPCPICPADVRGNGRIHRALRITR